MHKKYRSSFLRTQESKVLIFLDAHVRGHDERFVLQCFLGDKNQEFV